MQRSTKCILRGQKAARCAAGEVVGEGLSEGMALEQADVRRASELHGCQGRAVSAEEAASAKLLRQPVLGGFTGLPVA